MNCGSCAERGFVLLTKFSSVLLIKLLNLLDKAFNFLTDSVKFDTIIIDIPARPIPFPNKGKGRDHEAETQEEN